jgi:hypothetical protein
VAGCGNVCVTKAGLGKMCDDANGDRDCDHTLRCRQGMCQPLGQDGDPCEETADCDSLLWCDEFNQCVPLPNSGETCVIDDSTGYADPCRGSLVCTLVSAGPPAVRHCLPGQGAGLGCGSDQPCASGLRCAASDGVCHTISLPGGSCISRDDCPHNFECVAQVCVPLPGLGESCSPTLPCYQGSCVGGSCQYLDNGSECNGTNGVLFGQCSGYCQVQFESSVCAPLSVEGEPCLAQEACAPGLTCTVTDGGNACLACP